MNRIVLQRKVGSDGVLQLTLPVGPADANREVQITVEPVAPNTMLPEAWRSFVRSTAGSISDPTFERGAQGTYERREPLE